MEPVCIENTHATLVDLLDRILEKGLVINADVIISLAGIPLIGVNLRAALAGMETMLKYGVMVGWDEKTRAWEREQRKRQEVPLFDAKEEEPKLQESGNEHSNFLMSYLMRGEKVTSFDRTWHLLEGDGIFRNTWKSGHLFLTNRRLCWWDDFEQRIGFQAFLKEITGVIKKNIDFNPIIKDKRVMDIICISKGKTCVASFSGKQIDEWEETLSSCINKEKLAGLFSANKG